MKGGEREKEEENGEIAFALSSMNKKNKESSHFSGSITAHEHYNYFNLKRNSTSE